MHSLLRLFISNCLKKLKISVCTTHSIFAHKVLQKKDIAVCFYSIIYFTLFDKVAQESTDAINMVVLKPKYYLELYFLKYWRKSVTLLFLKQRKEKNLKY
jgi:hypothetical protein